MSNKEKVIFDKILSEIPNTDLDQSKRKKIMLWVYALMRMEIAKEGELNKIYDIVSNNNDGLKALAKIIEMSETITLESDKTENNEVYSSLINLIRLT